MYLRRTKTNFLKPYSAAKISPKNKHLGSPTYHVFVIPTWASLLFTISSFYYLLRSTTRKKNKKKRIFAESKFIFTIHVICTDQIPLIHPIFQKKLLNSFFFFLLLFLKSYNLILIFFF